MLAVARSNTIHSSEIRARDNYDTMTTDVDSFAKFR